MVAPNAREVLKKENKLLEDLAQRAADFARTAGVGADAAKAWERYFRGWHEINEALIKKDDPAFDQEVNEEVARLEGIHNSLKGDTANAKYWKTVLEEDIKETRRLL